MADKKISELDLALLINNDAVFPMSQDNAGEPTTFKVGITQLGTKIAEDMTFSNLRTTSKKLVGAINELLSLGSPILLGTTAPTSSQGANGNIYVQYTEGTGGDPDTVDSIYAKIGGAWCEIQTGGGGGTTDYEDLSNKPQVNSVELVGNKSLDDLGIMPASLSKTVSGSIAHFTDGADNIPVKSLTSEIVAVQSGSGTPSPSNPRAISGFDSGIITRCGKNLFSYDLPIRNGYWNDNAFVGTNAIEPKESATGWQYIRVYVKGLLSITLSGFDNQGGTNCAWLSSENVNDVISRFNSSNKNGTKTVPSGAKYLCLTIYSIKDKTNTYPNAQLELGDTATTYEAYNGNIYTFTFGQTVYGGHFDNKGNLVVTHGYIASYNGETINEPWISSIDEYVPNTSPSTGAQVVYPLTTPITLSITSQDIPTLLGENNIFSNCGDVEVNYYISNSDDIVDLIKSVGTGGFQPVIYSTDEREIGVWVDGKPLYEKTIVNSNPSYTQVGNIYECNTSVDFSGVDYFMIVNATALNANSTRPINDTRTDITAMGYVSIGKSQNNIYTAFNTNGYTKLVFTLRYTKTTDTAGSGQWTPQGVPTHHYSENEQVVGTWIDSSTIYEKTFDLGSDINISYDSWTETSISWQTLNINRLVGAEGFTSSGGTFAGTLLSSKKSNGNIEIQTPRNGTATGVRYLTVRYTKSV